VRRRKECRSFAKEKYKREKRVRRVLRRIKGKELQKEFFKRKKSESYLSDVLL
jgi:hypothetical protein